MLLEFRCENYKSIKDEVILSTIATKIDDKEESLLDKNQKRVLPVILIYGANGAGKTNILSAIGYLNFLIRKSKDFGPDDIIPTFPHKLSSSENSSFMIQFIKNNIRYAYGFTLNKNEVVEEFLYHFRNNRQAKIFERQNEKFSFGKTYKVTLTDIEEKWSKHNKLFLPVAATWSKEEDLETPFKYLNDDIKIHTGISNENWLNYTIKSIHNLEHNKRIFINFLNDVGINVKDIKTKIEKSKLKYEELPMEMPEELKLLISKGEHRNQEIKLQYDKIEINLTEESSGVRKLFEIGGPILDLLSKGSTLIYDELETSLHPFLVQNLIKLFMNPEINKNGSQLIFSTHDTNLLDLDLVRKDQIWFVEKSENDFSSELYSLSDLKDIRQNENIEKGYIRGKYGAIPFLENSKLYGWLNKENE